MCITRWNAHAGLYQAGPKNRLFGAWTLGGWLVNACYQAAIMFAMVMEATRPIYADRASGRTYSHWQVSVWHPSNHD